MTVVIVSQPSPSDLPAALAMVGRCSPASLLHRFHGPSDGVAYTTAQMQRAGQMQLEGQVHREGQMQRAGDVVLLAWEGHRCVGMGALSPDPDPHPDPDGDRDAGLHIGVLVEDDCQRQGVGRGLIRALVAEARRRGAGSIHADVMGEDRWLVAVLGRIGPTRVALSAGTYSVDIGL